MGDLKPWDLDTKLPGACKGPPPAPRGPAQGHRPREVHLRREAAGDALGPDGRRRGPRRRDRLDRHLEGRGAARREGGVDDRVARRPLRRARTWRRWPRSRPEIAEDAARLVEVTYDEQPVRRPSCERPWSTDAPLVYDDGQDARPGHGRSPASGNVAGPAPARPRRRAAGRRREGLRRGGGQPSRRRTTAPCTPTRRLETHGVVARVGGRPAHGLRLDPGRLHGARGHRRGARDRPQERPRDHRAHGRRLRQQARRPPRAAAPSPIVACKLAKKAGAPGEADARPQAGAPLHRQRPERAHDRAARREEGRHVHRHPLPLATARRASPAARAPAARRAPSTANNPNLQGRGVRRLHERRARPRRCALPATRRAPSRSSRRWTSWPTSSGMDPLELRRKNESSPVRRMPVRRSGAKAIGWERRNKKAGDDVDRRLTARRRRAPTQARASAWPTATGTSSPAAAAWARRSRSTATAASSSFTGAQDIGTGFRTAMADRRGRGAGARSPPTSRCASATRSFPQGPASGGSITTNSVAPVVRLAAHDARTKLFALAAPLLGRQARGARRRGREDLRGEATRRSRSPSSRPRRRCRAR